MKKRILSLLMVFCMLASLFPAGALAEEPVPQEPEVTEAEAEMTEPEAEVTEPEAEVTEPEADVTGPEAEATEPEAEVTEPEVNHDPAVAPDELPAEEEVSPETSEPVSRQEEVAEGFPEEQPAADPEEQPFTDPENESAEAVNPSEEPASDGSEEDDAEIEIASVGDETCGDNLTWTLDDAGLLTISGTGAMNDYHSDDAPWGKNIRSVVLEPGVTSIGDNAFRGCSDLTSVTLPNSVLNIGRHAFRYCSRLTSVTIPDGVTSIGNNAFRGCSDLTSMTIPESITSIGEWAFDECNSLTSVNIHDLAAWCRISFGNQEANPLYYAHSLYFDGAEVTDLVILSGVTSIGNYAFSGCNGLTIVTIPDSVTSIGMWAFEKCTSLQSVTIPDSVTSIGEGAFYGCSNLESVTIPDSVTSIGGWAFSDCTNLTSVTIPDGVTSIGVQTFYNCISLTSVTIPESVTSIGDDAFHDCSRLTSVMIPGSVTSIGVQTFYNCISLTSVTIPDSVTTINYGAFSGCSSLTSVTIGSSVTGIGESAFSDCTNLMSITIPDSVTTINNGAFSGCSSLTSVTIPESVTSIGYAAFSQCWSLESVYIHDLAAWCRISFADYSNPLRYAHKLYLNGMEVTDLVIPSGVTGIGDYTFQSCYSLTSVTIPDGVTRIGDFAFSDCTNLMSITIPDSVTSIGTSALSMCSRLDGVTIPDSVTNIGNSAFSACNSLTSITIPDSVTSIEESAFSGCTSLTSITIPDSVTTINYGAFLNCSSLTSITIPDSVTDIGDCAFQSCYSLTSVTIPDSVTQIGNRAFCGCLGLTSLKIGNGVKSIGYEAFQRCSSLTNVTIPDSVTGIGNAAFNGCSSLTSISIPDSVESIGENAFFECRNLDTVYYTGTAQTWNAIEIAAGNDALLNANLVLVNADWLVLPSALTFATEYLLLEMGMEPIELSLNLKNPTYTERVEWKTESGTDKVVSVEKGVVTVNGPGTDYVVASLSDGAGTMTARCRIDVLDEEKQGAREITVSLPVTQLTTEIYKTDYTRFEVILRLEQNIITPTSVTSGSGTEAIESGVTITGAQFVGNSTAKLDIRPYFDLRVVDDRTLEIVPTVDLNDTAKIKAIAGSYKSVVKVFLSDGSFATTPELKIKVGKALPKLTAKPVTVNGFIAGQTVPVEITGGSVTSVAPRDLGFATLNADMTVTVKDDVTKSGKISFSVDCQPDDWAVPATLKLTVNNQYKAPKLTLKPASVTLNPDVEDLAAAEAVLTPLPGMKHLISAEGVSGLDAFYDGKTGAVKVQSGSAAAGTYKVPVKADGKQVALLTVKVLPANSAVTLTAKAAGTIDTAVTKSPVVITVTGKNYNAAAGNYEVRILQTNKQLGIIDQAVNSLFDIDAKGNVITVTGTEALKNYVTGYTYTAQVSSSVGTAKPVKLNVKASATRPAASVTLKASGSIDVLRQGTEIVLIPTFKNWFDYDESLFGLRFNNPNLDYRYKDGVFTVFAKEGADVELTLKQAWMTYDGKDVTKPVNLSLKMGAAAVAQSTKAITLSKSDCYDRKSVALSLSDSSLYDIRYARVTLTDPSGALRLIELGNGEYAIGYKKNELPGNIAKLKSANIKLNVFLQGNDGSKPNATLSVKVSFA